MHAGRILIIAYRKLYLFLKYKNDFNKYFHRTFFSIICINLYDLSNTIRVLNVTIQFYNFYLPDWKLKELDKYCSIFLEISFHVNRTDEYKTRSITRYILDVFYIHTVYSVNDISNLNFVRLKSCSREWLYAKKKPRQWYILFREKFS